MSIVEDFGNSARRELALDNARARLQQGGEDFWGELFIALQNLLFRPEPELRPASSEPYVEAMLALPEPYVELLRKRLTPVLLKKLTTKRPATVPRAEVESFAELFAVLVKHRVVAVHGALTTMQMLLKKPDNRLAAVLMANHTVRVCDSSLFANEVPALEALRADLKQVPEAAFQSDIADILRKLPGQQQSTQQQQQQQQHADMSRCPPVLEGVGRPGIKFQVTSMELSAREHKGAIFTLTHDTESDSIITTGRDGKMVAWTADGVARQSLELDNYYACSADVNLRQQSLLLCGVPREATSTQPSACIFLYRRATSSGW